MPGIRPHVATAAFAIAVVFAVPADGAAQARFTGQGLIYSAQGTGGPIAVDSAGHVFAVESEPSVDAWTTSRSMFVTEFDVDARRVLYRTNIGHGNAAGIALDAQGHVVVAGSTLRQEFPATTSFTLGGTGTAAFVVKLGPNGAPIYSVVVAGASAAATAVAVDADGSAYVTGVASSGDFPTTSGAFDRLYHGGASSFPTDGFVFKLDASGTALLYATYLGGTSDDNPAGIAVDGSGHAYVAGSTLSDDFPVTASAFQITRGGGRDGFVAKLNPTGTALIYSTYLGGLGPDSIRAVALWGTELYVAGTTQSTNFPTTEFAERRNYIGNSDDAFVSRLDANGHLAASTYLGGSNTEALYGLAADREGFASVTGDTVSLGYPVTPDAIQTTAQGSDDAFVTRLNRNCAIVYSTFIGSSSPEEGRAIAVDSNADVYVSGRSGPDFPHSPDAVTTLEPENNWSPFLVKIVPRPGMGRSATASSQESNALGPANAIDGHPATRWSSAFADPQQLIIDLGRPVAIDRVVLEWETAYARSYDVLLSDDEQTWRAVYSTDDGRGGIVDIRSLDATGRYVAINGRERATEWGYSLWDVSVFGVAVEITNQAPNVSLASPTGETRFVAPAQINLSAVALDADGTVARVVFYVNGAQVAALTAPPYSTSYAAAAGTYTVVAEAVDNLGASSATNPITVYVLSEADLGPDIALGRPASASSVEAPGLDPSNAVDGDLTTRWSSAFSDPQWLSVDLGRRYQLNMVILRWESAAAQLFDIQMSDDGTSWTTIYNLTSATGGTEVLPLSGAGRYLRLLGRIRTTLWGYSLWELQAYGTPADSGNGDGTNLALGGQAFASSAENDALSAPQAIDGNVATRWSSAFADGEWLAVDLGAPYEVSRVVLRWETAYAARFAVQVSNDRSAWRTVLEADGHAAGDDLTIRATARYVRILGLQRATPWGFSLWEFEIYGSLASFGDNLAKDQVAFASSIEGYDFSANRAVDGLSSTRWASAWIDGQWIVAGLGGQAQIERVILRWETAYARRYAVQVGDTPSGPWQTVFENTTSDGGVDDLSVDGTGAYIRVLCEERATTWGCSLYELETYGVRTPPQANPGWNILVLIYDGTDFQYTDPTGQFRHVVGQISGSQHADAVSAATRFVNIDIPALTSQEMIPHLTIRSPGTLRSLSAIGFGWWPSPWDVAPDRDPAFDAVIVIWQPNVVDQATGEALWIGTAAGLTPAMGTGQTYTTLIADAATTYGHLNVFKHEFGHSITEYYDAAGTAPKPKVENHAVVGQYVNCTTGAAYVWVDETDANPIPNSIYSNESGFTHDYYSGTTALATDPARCLGVTDDAWRSGGPITKR